MARNGGTVTIAFWTGHAVSENRRLAPGRGRFRLSDEYRAFKGSLEAAIEGHAEQFSGPVVVRLTMRIRSRLDAQNLVKPVLDALQAAGVMKNDRQVQRLVVTRENIGKGEDDWISMMVTEAHGDL